MPAAEGRGLPAALGIPAVSRPMGKLILVTGGSRSGKSAFGQQQAESLPGPRVFIATCPVIDGEMNERIRRHQEARAGRGWATIEEPLALPEALERAARFPVVLVDCLTLWVNNVLYEAQQRGGEITETEITKRANAVIEAARRHGGTVIFITNEVGMGLVPDSPLGRRFRDVAGRANQIFGAACEEVYLAVCGQILKIKPQPSQR